MHDWFGCAPEASGIVKLTFAHRLSDGTARILSQCSCFSRLRCVVVACTACSKCSVRIAFWSTAPYSTGTSMSCQTSTLIDAIPDPPELRLEE